MSFLSLPLEVHQRILSYLLSNRDVAALSIQCRTLHAVCDMPTREKYNQIRVSSGVKNVDNAFNLLMDILRRPSLGQYVRCVECDKSVGRHNKYEETEYQRELNDVDMKLVRKAVQKGGFTGPKEDRVVNMLMQRGTDGGLFNYGLSESRSRFICQALAAILIVVSPNLVSLTMAPSAYFSYRDSELEFPLLQLLVRTNANPEKTTYLQNLQSVYLLNKRGDFWSDGRFYIPMTLYTTLSLFDNLPSIESVRCDIMEIDENEDAEYKDRCSNISRISILHSSVSSVYLTRVIWTCKILREFRYSIEGRSSNDGGYSLFNPKTFLKAICRHKETLEILDVDVEYQIHALESDDEEYREEELDRYESPFEPDVDEEETAFLRSVWTHNGSLEQFVALKRLSLGIKFLLYFASGCGEKPNKTQKKATLAECLPPSLEYLCIRGYQQGENPEHDEQMNALMNFYKSGSSQLKEIKGVEEHIPHAEPVHKPDNDHHLLWSLSELGYESD